MDRSTAEAVIAYADRGRFDTVDITGGAPELNPHIEMIIEKLAGFVPRIMLRSNLSVLTDGQHDDRGCDGPAVGPLEPLEAGQAQTAGRRPLALQASCLAEIH